MGGGFKAGMATGEKIKIEREKMKERKEKRRRITKKKRGKRPKNASD